MRIIILSIFTLFIGICPVLSQEKTQSKSDFPELTGPYVGQKPPGMIPEVFAPGIISNGYHELRITFSPDGDEAFYVIADKNAMNRIMVNIHMDHGKWSEPELVPFAWKHNNGSPFFSPDGNRIYFSSNRDNPHIIHDGSGLDIWYIERDRAAWSEPKKLPDAINSDLCEHGPAVAANGNLYFGYTDNNNQTFIYCSKYIDGQYFPREKIKMDIKSNVNIGSPFIAPDESYLLFQANIHGGFGGNDIYISFLNKDNTWKAPINLGEEINSEFSDIGPRVSFDGKYLFFTSSRSFSTEKLKGKTYNELIKMLKSPQNGYGTLFWVDAKIIEELKPIEFKN